MGVALGLESASDDEALREALLALAPTMVVLEDATEHGARQREAPRSVEADARASQHLRAALRGGRRPTTGGEGPLDQLLEREVGGAAVQPSELGPERSARVTVTEALQQHHAREPRLEVLPPSRLDSLRASDHVRDAEDGARDGEDFC
jgi:hypothetical protein